MKALILFIPLLFSASQALAITGTNSVQATFTSTIVPGTCTAAIKDNTGTNVTVLDIGDVFKTELDVKSKITPFSIALSDCAGVLNVNVSTSGGTCASDAYTNNQGESENAAVEFWHDQPESGTQFSCTNPGTGQTVSISGNSLTIPMNARMIVASSKSVSDVVPGKFVASLNFVLTYK